MKGREPVNAPTGRCLCGNVATIKKMGDWVCPRCDRIEGQHNHTVRPDSSGYRQVIEPYRIVGVRL